MYKAIFNCTNGLKAGETNIRPDDPRIAGCVDDLLARGILASMDGVEAVKASAAKEADALKAEAEALRKELDEVKAELALFKAKIAEKVPGDDSSKVPESEPATPPADPKPAKGGNKGAK